MKHNNSRMFDPIMLVIIVVGFYLRISNVFDQVPWNGEDFMAGRILESKQIVTDGVFPGVSKPLWQLMVAMGYQIMGFRLFVGSLLSVMFGTLIIALVYKYCRMLVNNTAGVTAALFTSCMLTFIHFSRLPQATVTSLSFMLLGMSLYGSHNKIVGLRRLILVGCVLGFTVVLHSIYFIPSLIILISWEFIHEYCQLLPRQVNIGSSQFRIHILRFIKRGCLILLSMLLPIVIAEIIIRVSRLYGIEAASWIGGAYLQMFGWLPSSNSMSDYLSYINMFIETDGIVVFMVFVISISILIYIFIITKLVIIFRAISIFIIPFVLLQISIITKGLALEKYYVIFMIGVPIIIGCCMGLLYDRFKSVQKFNMHYVWIQFVLVILVLASGYVRAQPRMRWTSGIDRAFIETQLLDADHIYYAMELGDFYFSTQNNASKLTRELSKSMSPNGNDLIVLTVEGECSCYKYNDECEQNIKTFEYVDNAMLSVTRAIQGYGSSLFGELKPRWCHVLYTY